MSTKDINSNRSNWVWVVLLSFLLTSCYLGDGCDTSTEYLENHNSGQESLFEHFWEVKRVESDFCHLVWVDQDSTFSADELFFLESYLDSRRIPYFKIDERVFVSKSRVKDLNDMLLVYWGMMKVKEDGVVQLPAAQ